MIHRELGRGGMGIVFEAHDHHHNSRVALKTLAALSAASIYQLKGEFRVLADVVHWNLIGLLQPPLANVYLGWDSGFWNSFNDGTGIHHPQGMTKSISFGYNEGALYTQFCDQNGQNCFWAHVWCVRMTTGTTLRGSSGSPVLDSDRRVRGTLSGGPNCDVSYYGRFAHAYDTLQPFINDIARPVYVDVNYGGPERGTSAEPFDQMSEAVYAVVAGDAVRIRPGSYDQQFRIFRPMRLEAEGGLVRIGAP